MEIVLETRSHCFFFCLQSICLRVFFSFFLFEIALNGIGRICYLFFSQYALLQFCFSTWSKTIYQSHCMICYPLSELSFKMEIIVPLSPQLRELFFFLYFAVFIRIKRFTIAINVILHQCSQRFAKEPLRTIIIFRVRNLVMLLVLYYLLSVNILLSLDYLFLYKMISSTT